MFFSSVQSSNAARALARLMSAFWVRFDPPVSSTIVCVPRYVKYMRQPAPL
jgi:hypothetical protein